MTGQSGEGEKVGGLYKALPDEGRGHDNKMFPFPCWRVFRLEPNPVNVRLHLSDYCHVKNDSFPCNWKSCANNIGRKNQLTNPMSVCSWRFCTWSRNYPCLKHPKCLTVITLSRASLIQYRISYSSPDVYISDTLPHVYRLFSSNPQRSDDDVWISDIIFFLGLSPLSNLLIKHDVSEASFVPSSGKNSTYHNGPLG